MRFFLDTNVVLYGLYQAEDKIRYSKAGSLFLKSAVISTQVISESVSATQRKFKGDIAACDALLSALMNSFTVVQVSTNTIRLALEVQSATGYAFYDSQLVAAALEAGCDRFYSEDMQDGRVVLSRLTILNPFA